jgi:hypothetical protein
MDKLAWVGRTNVLGLSALDSASAEVTHGSLPAV